MTANTSTFETIASTNYIDLYSLNDTPFKVKIYSAFIPVDDDPQCGNFACITYDANGNNAYQWYFSNYGALGRRKWDSTNQVWTDDDGTANTADYYLLNTTQSANQVFASPNGSSGKPSFRALVAADLPTVTYAKGGTNVAATSVNQAARNVYGARTAGDSLTLSGYIANGYLTSSKTTAIVLINLPYRLYSVTAANCTFTGTFTARQNNNYLFGSTVDTPRSLNRTDGKPEVTITAASGNGWLRMSFVGPEQTAAINNHPISIYFDSLTLNFAS